MRNKIKQYQFLFEELVKRDFTKKYKRTVLGMGWSIVSPLTNLLIMWVIFRKILGSSIEHYAIYLFSGQIVFSFFSDATNMGMTSLVNNAHIFSKINVPKYLFLFSQNVSSLINFGITLLVYFLFVIIDGVPLGFHFLLLLYPILGLVIFNLGVSLILSALYLFFRDMQYLWSVATQLIMWMSAIFYTVDTFSERFRGLFLCNPLYVFITYFRTVVLEGAVPSLMLHLLVLCYSAIALGIGLWIYKHYNTEFLYYV